MTGRAVGSPEVARRSFGYSAAVSALLHTSIVVLVVLAGRGASGPAPPIYRVDLIAAPAGPRAVGIVPASPRPLAQEQPQAPIPRRAQSERRDAVSVTKAPPARREPSRATATPDAKSARRDEPAPLAGGGPEGGTGTDVTSLRTEGIEFPFPSYLNNIYRASAILLQQNSGTRSADQRVLLMPLLGMGKLVPKKALDGFSLFLALLDILRNRDYSNSPLQPSAAIEHILRQGYEDYLFNHYPNAEERIQDIEQMTRFAMKYTSLETFVSELSLQSVSGGEAGEGEDERECVILSTVHQAKGLEWNTVFIIALNDGRFRSVRSLKTEYEEEERRPFFVAVTRAKDDLYLCYPFTSEEWSGLAFQRPSRFIRELPQDVYEEVVIEEIDEIY